MSDWFYAGVFMEDGKTEKIIKAENEVQRNIFIKRGLKPFKEKTLRKITKETNENKKTSKIKKKVKKCPEKLSIN